MADPTSFDGLSPTVVINTPLEFDGATNDIAVFRRGGIDKARVDYLGTFIGGTVGPSFGGAYEANESGSNISLSGGTMHQWITGTVGPIKGDPFVSWDNTNKRLVIGANGAGTYLALATGAGTLSAADDIEAAIFVNETETVLRADQAIANQATYQNFSVGGLVTLAVGDYVTLRMSTNATTRTWAMRHCHLSIARVS
jgi:hypothetical protein